MDRDGFGVVIHPVLETEQDRPYLHGDDGVLVIMEVYGLCPSFAINASVA